MGHSSVNRFAYSQQGRYQAISDGRYKLILDRSDDSAEFYDLVADAAETTNRAGELSKLEAIMRDTLSNGQQVPPAEAFERARDTDQNLRALGYIE